MAKAYRYILPEVLPYWKNILFLLVLMGLGIGFQMISPWPFKLLLDNVLGNELLDSSSLVGRLLRPFSTKESLGVFVVFLFFASNTLANLMEYFRAMETSKMVKEIVYRFSKSAFRNIESFDIGYYRKRNVGDYIYKLSYDVSAIGEFIEFGILPLLSSSVFVLLTIYVLYTIEPKLTLFSLGILPVLSLGLYYINKRITTATKSSERRYSTLFTFVDQALSQLKTIQAFKQETKQLKSYDERVHSTLESELRVNNLNLLLNLVMGLIIAASYSLIIGVGISAVFAGELSAGLLIVFMFYLDNLTSPILTVIDSISDMRQSYIKLARMRDIFNTRFHIHDTGTVTEMDDFGILFRSVDLHGQHEFHILKSVSCEIRPSTLTAIIGVSGSGKSSMASLLVRLINEPTSGHIFIGSHEIREYALKTLRKHIALVPQETVLFNVSIRDVIAFGKPSATDEAIKHAATLAAADDFIAKCPGGYSYKVGEQGNLLSGGQRQRLILARAFLMDPDILILDEIFASQDPTTKQRMVSNLRKFAEKKTVILVTNVYDVLKDTDDVILIHKGAIVKTGSFGSIRKLRKYREFLKPEQKTEGGE